MIEQALYFGLGCVVAGLLALGVMPALWARALRLTRRRLQMQIPVSMQEVLADRDHLRAEFALERRKLEQDVERVQSGRTQDMVELGRRAAVVVALRDQVGTLETVTSNQAAEIAALNRELAEHMAQSGGLALALHDTHHYFEQRLDGFTALKKAHERHEEEIETRRTTIAGLNTRVAGLEMTIEDATRAKTSLSRQYESLRQEVDRLTQERDMLIAKFAEAGEAGVSASVPDRGDESGRPDDRDREKIAHVRKSLQAEQARSAGHAMDEKIGALRAENSALRDALADARRQGNAALGARGDQAAAYEGDALLRTQIHELGLAVARLNARQRVRDEQGSLA